MIARRPAAGALASAAAAAASCGAPAGTIDLSIVTAPGSAVMDDIERVRLTLSDPPAVADAEREDGGFDLALDVEAAGERGRIALEAFDEGGDRIAVAHAGPVPVASIDADIAMYLAPPDSIGEAPVSLGAGRSEIGAAALQFGAFLAGGRDADGAPVADATIYNVHRHDFQEGQPLPEPRAGPAVTAAAPQGPVYLFGGEGEEGAPTDSAWSFNTAEPPAGAYLELEVSGGVDLARAGRSAAPLPGFGALVAGDPPVEIDASAQRAGPFPGAPPMRGTATAGGPRDEPFVLVTGAGGEDAAAARWEGSGLRELEAPDSLRRADHAAADLPGGEIIVVGGRASGEALGSAIRYDPSAGEDDAAFEVLDAFLDTRRAGAAAARARDRLVVAGGRGPGGDLVPTAEVFDAHTLAREAEIPLVAAREGAEAVPLANGQILIAGGTGEDGDPIATLELFTPDL